MIFDEFHNEMDMMMDWKVDIWFFLVVGLIVFVLLTILILSLMNKSTKQVSSLTHIDDSISGEAINSELNNNFLKFCPRCGEKLLDNKGNFCPTCGNELE